MNEPKYFTQKQNASLTFSSTEIYRLQTDRLLTAEGSTYTDHERVRNYIRLLNSK